MRDKYRCFSDLLASEQEGRAYKHKLMDRDSDIVVIAPHGGGIEQGTSEIAEAVAGEEFSLYCFNGIKRMGNEKLHITSTLFDELSCVDLVKRSRVVVGDIVKCCGSGLSGSVDRWSLSE